MSSKAENTLQLSPRVDRPINQWYFARIEKKLVKSADWSKPCIHRLLCVVGWRNICASFPKKVCVEKMREVGEWPQHWLLKHNLPQMPMPSYTWPWPPCVLLALFSYFFTSELNYPLSTDAKCQPKLDRGHPALLSLVLFAHCSLSTNLVWAQIEKCKILIVLPWLKNATSFCGDAAK